MTTQAILITGRPGSGKTTLLQRAVSALSVPAGGFYTQEIRQRGIRQGFELVTLVGERGLLAHVEKRSQHRVGRYGVDITALDTLGVAAIRRAISARGVVVIDEIGPMELLSAAFRQAVLEALDSEALVLATVTWRSTVFTDRIKNRPEAVVLDLRPDNREAVLERVLALMESAGALGRSGILAGEE